MTKFYLVDKETDAEEVAIARAKGFRIADRKFEGEFNAAELVNPTEQKPKRGRKAKSDEG